LVALGGGAGSLRACSSGWPRSAAANESAGCTVLDENTLPALVLLKHLPIYLSVDALRRTQYRTPVGPLENAVLCCALFTKPYHSNVGAVLLRLCVAMGMLLHSNEHLQIITVTDRLSIFAILVATTV
jgi:hypothetical protein